MNEEWAYKFVTLDLAMPGDDRFLDAPSHGMIMQAKPAFLVCPTCKKDIKGTAYACPECATMYCIRCAIMKAERKEPCLKCNKPLQFG